MNLYECKGVKVETQGRDLERTVSHSEYVVAEDLPNAVGLWETAVDDSWQLVSVVSYIEGVIY